MSNNASQLPMANLSHLHCSQQVPDQQSTSFSHKHYIINVQVENEFKKMGASKKNERLKKRPCAGSAAITKYIIKIITQGLQAYKYFTKSYNKIQIKNN